MTAIEAFRQGIENGKMYSLNELMIKILTHGYSVDNIISEIDTMRDELNGSLSEQYAKDATADHNTSEQFPNV